jgi:hypothetical protein
VRASLATAVTLAALALAAPAAFGQAGQQAPGGGPFSPLPPAQQQTQTQTTPTPQTQTTGAEDNSNDPSTIGVFGLFAAGVLVIVVIGWVIMRDARKSLPERHRRRKRKKTAVVADPPAGGAKRPPPPPRHRKGASARSRRSKGRSKRRAR